MAVIVPKQQRGQAPFPDVLRSAWRDIRGIALPNTLYVLTPLMNQADIDDASLVIPLAIEVSDDGVGQKDYVLISEDIHLGARDRNGNPTHAVPVLKYQTSSDPPNFIRARVDLPRSLSIGLDISLA